MGKFSDALKAEIGSYADTEWRGTLGGLDVVIVSKPMTPNDIMRIDRLHPNFAQSPKIDGMVDMIILKATDENGDKAFDKTDKPLLMRCGTNKIGEIFAALFSSQMVEQTDEEFEESVKN